MRVRPVSLLSAAIAVALFPSHALAQPAADDDAALLDRITVTAQKREQQVEEVPISMTAYSGEFLDSFGISGFDQLSDFVPGLEVQLQSPNNPGFVIRGITSDSGSSQVEPRVSVFQDGVSISKSRGSVVELFDLERVEVLRGPQGTLFGRGAQIGAVHLIQNKAVNDTTGAFEIGAGNYSETFLTGHINAPIAQDRLYARLAVFHQERDGSVENLSGGTLNGKETNAVRASLGMDLGDRARLDFILNYQRDTPPGTAFRSRVLPTRAGSLDTFDYTADLNRGEELGLKRTVRSATLLGDFGLSDAWSLSSITGWRDFDSNEEFDADGSQANLLEFAEVATGRQFSQELRFNYDPGGRFSGFFGGSFFTERGQQRVPYSGDERSLYALLSPILSGATGGALPVVPVLNPDGTPNLNVPPALPGLIPGGPAFFPLKPLHEEEFSNFGQVRAYEVFADGTFEVTDRLDVTVGLRGSRERVESGYESLYFGQPSAIGQFLGAFPNVIAAPTDGRITGEGTFNSAVGRAIASYRVSDRINAYTSVSRGRRPNVINVGGGGASEIPAEIVISYEAGIKGNANSNRFLYDAAVFYYDYSDFQASIENPDPPPFFIPTNAGNARAKGAELSLLNRFTDGFSGFLNIGWIDARFNAFDDAGNPQQLAGNRFRLTPEYTAAIGADWSVPVAVGRFYVRPSYTWRSSVFIEEDNDAEIAQGAYGLAKLRVGLAFGEAERYELTAFVNNALDKDYLIDAGNTGALFGIPTFIPGQPRTYGLRFGARF